MEDTHGDISIMAVDHKRSIKPFVFAFVSVEIFVHQ